MCRATIYEDMSLGHKVCDCSRWWTSYREAILDGWFCVDGKCSCDYCRDDVDESEGDDE